MSTYGSGTPPKGNVGKEKARRVVVAMNREGYYFVRLS